MRFIIFALVLTSSLAWAQILDLSIYNFDNHTITTLNGEWDFYWNKLLTPPRIDSNLISPDRVGLPHSWLENEQYSMFGFGTYRMQLKLPLNVQGQLSIFIPYVRCAAKVFVNGKVIDSLGTVGDKIGYRSQLGSLLVNLPNANNIDLVIQVANYDFRWGGLGSNIRIGKTSAITHYVQVKSGFDIFFIGSLFAMSLYLVTMFFLYREGYSFLFLSMICLAVVLRSLTTEGSSLFLPTLFPEVGWAVWKKIEFFSVYGVVAFFPLYVSHVFPKESSKKIDMVFLGLASLLCATVLFTDHYIYVLVLDVCHVGLLLGFVYACVVSFKAWRNKNSDAKTLFFGILVAFPFIFLEILKNSALQLPIPFTHLVEFGVLSFLLFQVYVLANHYAMTYQELESVVKAKTAELTESNEIKNKMLAILSHDVRGPVNMLKVSMSMFNKGHFTIEELKSLTKKIESQTGNVSLLIENILLLVKSQLNGIEVNLETFLLADWVNSHVSLYNMQAAEKEIELKSIIPDHVKVKADKNIISLVVRNLIANAIKFSNRGTLINILIQETETSVVLSFADTGQGMTSQQVQSIFLRKASIWSMSGTEKETGTGLGLKLCREYLLKMNCDFAIDSEPGRGTTISIQLEKM